MLQRSEISQIPLAAWKASLEYQKSLTNLASDGVKRCFDLSDTCGQIVATQADAMLERAQALSYWPHSGLAPLEIGSRQMQNGLQSITTLQGQVLRDQKALTEGLHKARMVWQQTFFDAVGNSDNASDI